MSEQLEELRSSIVFEGIRDNPLLNRREVDFLIVHMGRGTPDRWSVRQAIASQLGVPVDCVIVKSLNTRAGTNKTRGHAHVYYTPQDLSRVEPKHIVIRNLPPDQREEALKSMRRGGG